MTAACPEAGEQKFAKKKKYTPMESPTYILNEDTQPVIRAIGVSRTACKDEFRQISQVEYIFVFLYITLYIDRRRKARKNSPA